MTSDRERLIQAHQMAADYFAAQLFSSRGDDPRQYLGRRGLAGPLTDPAWAIGYAPPTWTSLTDHLRCSGFTDQELEASGLAFLGPRRELLARFRDRIVLGLRDEEGTVVGFVGRCSPRAEHDCPKYLNSPSTPIYAKGRVLFGLAEQRERLDGGATPILVEGPLDVLAVASLGDQTAAVSPCGVALHPQQVRMLRSLSDESIVVAFDADEPGRRAARTAYDQLIVRFDQVLGAQLPTGEDPGSLAATQPEILRRALATAPPLVDRLVEDKLQPFLDRLDNAEARVCALHCATRLLADLDPTDVGRQVTRISERLDFEPAEVLRDLIAAYERGRTRSTATDAQRLLHGRSEPSRPSLSRPVMEHPRRRSAPRSP